MENNVQNSAKNSKDKGQEIRPPYSQGFEDHPRDCIAKHLCTRSHNGIQVEISIHVFDLEEY